MKNYGVAELKANQGKVLRLRNERVCIQEYMFKAETEMAWMLNKFDGKKSWA